MTAPERLAGVLRERILAGDIPPGTPLREQSLSDEHNLGRHTVRAALRVLASEGIVRIEANRGAWVPLKDAAELVALGELRVALEVEAARLALARHGRLPDAVHKAQRRLEAADGAAEVTVAHEALHGAIVAAAGSPRIQADHERLAGELRLFLVQLRGGREAIDLGELVAEHAALLAAIEGDEGPEALRVHIMTSTAALTTGLKF